MDNQTRQLHETRPANSIAEVSKKRQTAYKMRAGWLQAIEETRIAQAEGRRIPAPVTLADLMQATSVSQGKTLLNLRLTRLTGAATGWPRHRVLRALNNMCRILRLDDLDVTTLNLAWLLDVRTSGRRLSVWIDQITPHPTHWVGFPYSPPACGQKVIKDGAW